MDETEKYRDPTTQRRSDRSADLETRLRQVREELEQRESELARVVQSAVDAGQLKHLNGKPLDLSDDSPEWFANKMLKEAGFSHPILERRKDLAGLEREAEQIIERLQRRRAHLTHPETRATALQVHAFNELRLHALRAYREKLAELNRAIRDYNLGAPTLLQVPSRNIDAEVASVAEAIPALPLQPPPSSGRPSSPWPTRLWQHLRGARLRHS